MSDLVNELFSSNFIKTIMLYSQIKALKNELDLLRPLSKEQEGMIMQKFRLDWNYHSNHLEGNSLTYGETKALILFGLTAQGKPLNDHIEMTGHDEAVKWIEDIVRQERPLTENFIRELHTLLLKETSEKKAKTPEGIITTRRITVGQYKTVPNHVETQTGEIFYFATPEETPAKMGDLMAWYQEKQAQDDVEPILLAAEFHYNFIRIHPFDDGNGRTARLIMNFILMRFGYPPVIIKTDDKENYFNVLQLADAGNLEPFVEYIAKNLIHSLEIMMKGAKGESIDEPDDLDKEIALLEMKLKGMGGIIEGTKNRENIVSLFDKSFERLAKKFLTQSYKFDKFYLNKKIEIIIDDVRNLSQVSVMSDLYSMSLRLNNVNDVFNPNHLGFVIIFENIKQLSLVNSNFISGITIEFNDYHYSINTVFDEREAFLLENAKERPYSEQLTDEEIDFIVKSEMKRHTEFIESKIKEMG